MQSDALRSRTHLLESANPPRDGWVRTVREANGLSTADLARALDVPVWRIEHWEHDQRLPKGRKVRGILNAYALRVGLPTR